jgi:hypothetical protein
VSKAWLLAGFFVVAAGVAGEGLFAREAGGVETAARLYGAGSGRITVIAEAGEGGRRLATLSGEAWTVWMDGLALPDRWPVALTARLVRGVDWRLPEPSWRVVGEPGGIVTVWVKDDGQAGMERDRRWLMALAEAALYRQGVALGELPERIWIPDWLVAGAAEAVLANGERVAMQDAWRQAARRATRQPPLLGLLGWKGGVQEAWREGDVRVVAAYGLWQWWRAESGGSTAWRRLLAGLLAGEAPRRVLNEAYGERFRTLTAADLELAWQTAAAGLARVSITPMLSAEESRRWLGEVDRLVVLAVSADAEPANSAESSGPVERAVRLSEDWAGRREPMLVRERRRRGELLAANFARMHPFYRNAAGSLGRTWLALDAGREQEWRAAREEWLEDLAVGRELERGSADLLEAASR